MMSRLKRSGRCRGGRGLECCGRRRVWRDPGRALKRRGAATLEYVLVIGALAVLSGLSLYLSSKLIVLAYDMVCAFVAWPFS